MSLDELAKSVGYKGASSLQRYESDAEFTKTYMAQDLVDKLTPVLMGKGTPPIERDEVQALSNSEARSRLLKQEIRSLIDSYDPDDDGIGYTREKWTSSLPGSIPEIDVKLGAGQGVVGEIINIEHGHENISAHRVVAEWILSDAFINQELRSSRQSTVIMEVIGDSMSPTYQPGDRVIVDLNQTSHIADTVYAISDGETEPQIKRLQRVPFTSPARVKIISDNPALETFEADLDMVQIIGRVCGHIARR